MPGRVHAVLLSLLLFFIPAAALPQCDYHLDYSGPFRSSVLDLSMDGADLWIATGYGVQLLDRSVDPPKAVAAVALPGLTRVVRGTNGVAYAGGTTGLHVVRKNGHRLEWVLSVGGAPVNDLVLLPPGVLYAATPAGIAVYSLINPLSPAATGASVPTSSANVQSLAAGRASTLFAADGDSSVEVFSTVVPASPQKIGAVDTSITALSVNTTSTRLYVSDGQRSEVFAATTTTPTRLGTLPLAAAHVADLGTEIVAVAGNDRIFRAVDANAPESAVTLFEQELVPGGGTVNRITALGATGGRLYVGAGDMGLATYDLSHFSEPFPVRAYTTSAPTSLVAGSTAVYIGKGNGGIQELTRSAAGSLTVARQWGSGSFVVHDESDRLLIASSGQTLSMFTLAPTVPTLVTSAVFSKSVKSAALVGSKAIVLLDDGTIWTADMSQTSPSPVRAAGASATLSQLAVSDRGVAATELLQDGNTVVDYWNGTNLDAAPLKATVPGTATALALDGTQAAVFTFKGITVVNFSGSAPASRILPQSNTAFASSLRISGDRLLVLADKTLRVWNLATDAIEKSIPIPGSPTSLDVAGVPAVAAISTATGVVSVNFNASTSLPVPFAQTASNAYYRDAAASATRLYLFDGRAIDVFEIAGAPAPRFVGSISAPGTIDLAASDTTLFTLASSGIVSAYGRDGALIASKALNEGSDVVPLSIAAVPVAPWVSISRGCLTSGCEKKTIVLDPQSLVRSATLNGGTVAVTVNGTRAFSLTDLPAELHVYDVTDALHPSQRAVTPNDTKAVAIAYANGTVYALGDKVYAYRESDLARTGEQLAPLTPSANAKLIVDGGCASISGRSLALDTYALPQWSAATPLSVPGSVRALTLGGGRLLVLTDYSIEIWSRGTRPSPVRRRAVH